MNTPSYDLAVSGSVREAGAASYVTRMDARTVMNDRDYSSSASILEKMTLCMRVSGSRTRRGRKSERPGST